MDRYTIELNRTQIKLIAQALEMHSRAICGQIEESFSPPIKEELWKHYKTGENIDNSEFYDKRKKVEEHLLAVKEIIWPGFGPGASEGVGYDEIADLGYEMYKHILSQFEKELQKEKGEKYEANVHTGTPLKLTKEPVIKIKKIKSEKLTKNYLKHNGWELVKSPFTGKFIYIKDRYDDENDGIEFKNYWKFQIDLDLTKITYVKMNISTTIESTLCIDEFIEFYKKKEFKDGKKRV